MLKSIPIQVIALLICAAPGAFAQEACDGTQTIDGLAPDVKKSCERVAPLPGVDNFHVVLEKELYRGGAPNPEAVDNLFRDYHIKTIVDLESFREDVITQERETVFKHAPDLQFVEAPMGSLPWVFSAFSRVDKKQMDQTLTLMLDPKNQPVYVHCMKGQDRTGLVVGLYLVKSGKMTPAQACQDMLDHGFYPKFWSLAKYFEKETGYHCPPSN